MSITMTIVSISRLSFSRSFAIVSMVSITISMAITMSISMTIVSISRLCFSRSFAIVSMVSITITIISITWLSSGSWLSFSISRPLAIVSMVSIAIAMTITMSISMAIIAIARLGSSHSKEGKRNSNQE